MTRAELEQMAREQADRFGVPVAGYFALIAAESSWNPDAVGPVGEKGLVQFMPGTAQDMGVEDPFDPRQALEGGARYLAYLRDYVLEYAPALNANPRAMWSAVLGCYNWGLGNWGEAYDRLGDEWIQEAPQSTVTYIVRLLPSFAPGSGAPKKAPNIALVLALVLGALVLA